MGNSIGQGAKLYVIIKIAYVVMPSSDDGIHLLVFFGATKLGFFNKLFGFRWSLYVVENGNVLTYAMHEHAVMAMVGYVMKYFADGGQPVEPWSLYLNFNHNHQSIKLGPEHFTQDGEK